MHKVMITGTGLFVPDETITNAELVASYNAYAGKWNADHQAEIDAGTAAPLPMSSEESSSSRHPASSGAT